MTTVAQKTHRQMGLGRAGGAQRGESLAQTSKAGAIAQLDCTSADSEH